MITLNAVQVPAPQMSTAFVKLSDAAASLTGIAPTAKGMTMGDGPGTPATTPTGIISNWNRNALALDQSYQHGGGARGIVPVGGMLALSAAGLVATIQPGRGNIDGPVDIDTAATVALTDGVPNWIWLLQTGHLQAVPTALTAPSSACIYLGCVVTSSGAPTLVDTSGVVMLRGMGPWRQTHDTGVPGDTPPANLMIWTRTQGGLYLWDGVGYAGPL